MDIPYTVTNEGDQSFKEELNYRKNLIELPLECTLDEEATLEGNQGLDIRVLGTHLDLDVLKNHLDLEILDEDSWKVKN